MKETPALIAQMLLQINAIKLSPQSPFTWASGLKSPIYCDNRILLSHPKERAFIVDSFVGLAKKMDPFDIVAGVATAGIPHGALLADRLGLPFIYVRSKAKEHGRQNLIEGDPSVGKKALVVEDLISTGGSSVKAVHAVRAAGLEVAGVVAIFTYGFDKAIQTFQSADCPFLTLSNYDALVVEAIENNYIPAEYRETLAEWRRSPDSWSAQFS